MLPFVIIGGLRFPHDRSDHARHLLLPDPARLPVDHASGGVRRFAPRQNHPCSRWGWCSRAQEVAGVNSVLECRRADLRGGLRRHARQPPLSLHGRAIATKSAWPRRKR